MSGDQRTLGQLEGRVDMILDFERREHAKLDGSIGEIHSTLAANQIAVLAKIDELNKGQGKLSVKVAVIATIVAGLTGGGTAIGVVRAGGAVAAAPQDQSVTVKK